MPIRHLQRQNHANLQRERGEMQSLLQNNKMESYCRTLLKRFYDGRRSPMAEQKKMTLSIQIHGTQQVQIAYTEQGNKDGIPLIFIHGLAISKTLITELVFPCLPQWIRAIALDLPGFGDSEPVRFDKRPLYEVQTVLSAFLDRLCIARKVHLYGMSMGGTIALIFAAEHSSRLASVTAQGVPLGKNIVGLLRLLGIFFPLIFYRSAKSIRYTEALLRLYFCNHDLARIYERYPSFSRTVLDDLCKLSVFAFFKYGIDLFSINFKSIMTEVKIPTLLLDGDHIEIPYLDTLPTLIRLIPSCSIETMRVHAGHLATFACADEIAPRLVSFIQRHEGQ